MSHAALGHAEHYYQHVVMSCPCHGTYGSVVSTLRVATSPLGVNATGCHFTQNSDTYFTHHLCIYMAVTLHAAPYGVICHTYSVIHHSHTRMVVTLHAAPYRMICHLTRSSIIQKHQIAHNQVYTRYANTSEQHQTIQEESDWLSISWPPAELLPHAALGQVSVASCKRSLARTDSSFQCPQGSTLYR
jgi:hypothetical protein